MWKGKAYYRFKHTLLLLVVLNVLFVGVQALVTFLEEKEAMSGVWTYVVRHQLPGLAYDSLFFYGSLNVFYGLFARKAGVLPYITFSIPVLLLTMCFYVGLELYLPVNNDKVGLEEAVVYLVIALLMLLTSLAIVYVTGLRAEREKKRALERQQTRLELQMAYAQLAFLRAQINPHFLHNSLSFLYVKALPLSTELSDSIMTLSDVMRYALNDNTAQKGKVRVEEEVSHLRNVIKMNRLRFGSDLCINLEVIGAVNCFLVPAFVLITIAENAIKHGELREPGHPVTFRLEAVGGRIRFTASNKKKQGPKEPTTGIGLQNIRQQLDLIYDSDFDLEIREDAESYSAVLTIKPL